MHKKFELGDIFVLPDSPFRTHLFLTATEILGSTEWTQKPRWLQGTLRRITDPAFGVTGDRMQVGSCGAERRVAKERHHQGRCGVRLVSRLIVSAVSGNAHMQAGPNVALWGDAEVQEGVRLCREARIRTSV